MRSYLRPLQDLEIEIIEFDPDAPDPIFARLRQTVQSQSASLFAHHVGITQRAATLVYQAIGEAEVPSLVRLSEFPGLGNTTIERLYAHFRTGGDATPPPELTLFEENGP
jgi:hypothetical protein